MKRLTDEQREAMAEFKASVQPHPCAACGNTFGYQTWSHQHAHHVVYQQHIDEAVRWDPRNAMSTCSVCHEAHHNASRRIPLSRLSSTHLEFAREVLGDYADDYLKRYYGDA
jgi:5-methylcytosine-specific restriction endonuclease McrA